MMDIIAAACVHMGSTIAQHLLEVVWVTDNYIYGYYDEENPTSAGEKLKSRQATAVA